MSPSYCFVTKKSDMIVVTAINSKKAYEKAKQKWKDICDFKREKYTKNPLTKKYGIIKEGNNTYNKLKEIKL